ncbi:hypothetical protein C0J52_27487, partial [Blattella germanica]
YFAFLNEAEAQEIGHGFETICGIPNEELAGRTASDIIHLSNQCTQTDTIPVVNATNVRCKQRCRSSVLFQAGTVRTGQIHVKICGIVIRWNCMDNRSSTASLGILVTKLSIQVPSDPFLSGHSEKNYSFAIVSPDVILVQADFVQKFSTLNLKNVDPSEFRTSEQKVETQNLKPFRNSLRFLNESSEFLAISTSHSPPRSTCHMLSWADRGQEIVRHRSQFMKERVDVRASVDVDIRTCKLKQNEIVL